MEAATLRLLLKVSMDVSTSVLTTSFVLHPVKDVRANKLNTVVMINLVKW